MFKKVHTCLNWSRRFTGFGGCDGEVLESCSRQSGLRRTTAIY